MFFSQSSFAVAALGLLNLAAASPLDTRSQGFFDIVQVPSQRKAVQHPALAAWKNIMRWGGAISAELQETIDGVQNGSVKANPEGEDTEYLSPVQIGSTTLNLDFDTGSGDLWVFSSQQSAADTAGHALYKVQANQKVQGATWALTYGDGSGAKGNVYRDTVKIGGVTATKQAVEAATSVSSTFLQDRANDGLVGLSFGTLNRVQPVPAKTFFENVQDSLAKPVFTTALKKGAPGTYSFGWIDKAKYTGDIVYTPVLKSTSELTGATEYAYWAFKPQAVKVGSGASTPTEDLVAIADTGTSLWYLPTAQVEAYWGQVKGASYNLFQGGYTYPCSASLPDVEVTIEGKPITVAGKFLKYAPVSASECFGGLQPNDATAGAPGSIFGDVFLKGVFAVFDLGEKRLGFAQQA